MDGEGSTVLIPTFVYHGIISKWVREDFKNGDGGKTGETKSGITSPASQKEYSNVVDSSLNCSPIAPSIL